MCTLHIGGITKTTCFLPTKLIPCFPCCLAVYSKNCHIDLCISWCFWAAGSRAKDAGWDEASSAAASRAVAAHWRNASPARQGVLLFSSNLVVNKEKWKNKSKGLLWLQRTNVVVSQENANSPISQYWVGIMFPHRCAWNFFCCAMYLTRRSRFLGVREVQGGLCALLHP